MLKVSNVELDHVPKTEYYKGSFLYRGGMLWNSLPNDIKASESKALKENWLVGGKLFTTFYSILLFVHIFSVVVQYLLLFLYGFHVKKLCNLWNYRIQIKVNQSIYLSVYLSVFFVHFSSVTARTTTTLKCLILRFKVNLNTVVCNQLQENMPTWSKHHGNTNSQFYLPSPK